MVQKRKEEHAQSVLEFLVSYAWMFLIIAIVAYVLYILGAYTPNLSPHAIAGTCQVSRPYGPYTTYLVALDGTCNNLPPAYVGELSQSSGGHIIIPLQSPAISSNQLTLVFWLTITGSGRYPQNILTVNGTPEAFSICQQGTVGNTTTPWQFIVLTINTSENVSDSGTDAFLYVNNTLVDAPPQHFSPTSSNGINIGGAISGNHNCLPIMNTPYYGLNGEISNLQVYDTVLTKGQMKELYLEGLGGEPITLQNLLAWWPLNGDTSDYSGNGRSSGSTAGIAFSGLLIENYSVP
jgi:hypothetical protein